MSTICPDAEAAAAAQPETPRVQMHVSVREAYTPDEIRETLTLGELLEAVEQAIETYGDDAQIIVNSGDFAPYGSLSRWSEIFTAEPTIDDI